MKHYLVLVSSNEEPKELDENECPERFFKFLRSIGCNNISIFGYTFFKESAENYGATKTVLRGKRMYAYFGKTYVRYS